MREKQVVAQGNSVGAAFLLFLVFLVLKLTGVIAWSWLWVLAPLWIPLALAVLVVVIGLIVLGIRDSR